MNQYLRALNEKATLLRQAQRLEAKESHGGGLNAAEQAEYDKNSARLTEVGIELTEMEAQRAAATTIAPDAEELTEFPIAPGIGRSYSAPRQASSLSYRTLFPKANIPSHGLKSFDQFAQQLMRARVSGIGSESLQMLAAAGAGEGLDSAGGAYVPSQFIESLLTMALESQVVMPRARVIPMTEDTALAPGFDSLDHSGGNIAGLSGQWIGEGASVTTEVPLIFMQALKAKKMAALVPVSNELWGDSMSFQGEIMRRMAEAAAFTLDTAFLVGKGAGQPLGLLNDNAKITVTKESGQASGTFLYLNAAHMWSRLAPACARNAIWIVSPSVLPQLVTMNIPIGTITGGQGTYGAAVPVMPDGSGGYTLFGRPVVVTEKTPALGTEGDVILADLSQYVIGMRQEFRLDTSVHVYFNTDQIALRLVGRFDGMGTWRTAITPANGSTLSWVVTLQSR